MMSQPSIDMADDPRPPTEGEALFMMIAIIFTATIVINSIVYAIVS